MKGKEEMKAKISVGSSAFAIGAYERHPIPFETVLERLVELGFDGVELFGAKPYGHPSDFPTQADRRNFRRRLDDLGLIPSNYGADLWGFPLGASKAEASRYEEAFKMNLEFCLDIGCDSIRVDTVSEPPLPEGVSYDDAWQRVVGTWQNCSKWAREAQTMLYWEFEPGFMFNKPERDSSFGRRGGRPEFQADVRHLSRPDGLRAWSTASRSPGDHSDRRGSDQALGKPNRHGASDRLGQHPAR